jgi:hypothetical protein
MSDYKRTFNLARGQHAICVNGARQGARHMRTARDHTCERRATTRANSTRDTRKRHATTHAKQLRGPRTVTIRETNK